MGTRRGGHGKKGKKPEVIATGGRAGNPPLAPSKGREPRMGTGQGDHRNVMGEEALAIGGGHSNRGKARTPQGHPSGTLGYEATRT